MSIGGVSGAGASAALNQASGGSEMGVAVLKKAMDQEEQSAQKLIQSLDNTARSGNLPGMGGNVDTSA